MKVTGGGATTPGHVELQVTLRNTSSLFPGTCNSHGRSVPAFHVGGDRPKGKRVDLRPVAGLSEGLLPDAKLAFNRREGHARVGDGTAKPGVTWDAVKMKWAPERAKMWDGRGFPRSPDKLLGKGKYCSGVILPSCGDRLRCRCDDRGERCGSAARRAQAGESSTAAK